MKVQLEDNCLVDNPVRKMNHHITSKYLLRTEEEKINRMELRASYMRSLLKDLSKISQRKV